MNTSDLDYIKDCVQQMQPYDFIYTAHSYFLCVFTNLLTAITLYYVKYFRFKSNVELKPLAIYNCLCCWAMITFSTLNQPVALAKLNGGYSLGIIWVCYFVVLG